MFETFNTLKQRRNNVDELNGVIDNEVVKHQLF